MIDEIKSEFRHAQTFLTFAIIKIASNSVLFLIPLILAKFLSPSHFGSYTLAMMVVYLLSAFLIRPFSNPYIILANEELKKTESIKKSFTARLILVCIGIFISLFFFIIFKNFITNFAAITHYQLYFLILSFLGITMYTFFISIMLSCNKRLSSGMFELFIGIIAITYLSSLIYFKKFTLEFIFPVFFVSACIAIPAFISFIKKSIIKPLTVDKTCLKQIAHFGKWIIFGTTATYFINWGDNIVLRNFVTLEKIGVYNLGYQIFKGSLIIMAIITTYFAPFLAQNVDNKKKLQQFLIKKRPKIMLVGLLGIIIGYLLIPIFFKIIYLGAFDESAHIARILFIGSLFALYKTFHYTLFIVLRKYKFVHLAQIFFVSLNLILDFILISIYGMKGAAIATTITYASMALIYEIYYKTYIKKKYIF